MLDRLPVVLYEARPSPSHLDLWYLVYANQALEALTGYPPGDFMGEHPERFLYEMIHPDDRARVGVEYDRCRTAESMVSVRYRVRHRRGGYRQVEERTVFERDAEGVLHAFGTLLDAREPARQARRNADLDATLDRFNADVAVATGQAFLEHLCRRLSHLMGVRQVAILRVVEGRNLETLARVHDGLMVPPYSVLTEATRLAALADQPRLEVELDADYRSSLPNLEGLSQALAFRLDNRQGQWLGALVLDHDGPISTDKTLERVLELYTDRAVTEIERLSLERRLQESDARYRAFFDTAVQPTLVVNPLGRVVNLNQAARRLFAVPEAQRLELADILPRQQPDGRASLYHLLRLTREAGNDEVAPLQWVVHTLAGEERTTILHITPTMMNLTERILLTFEDITDKLQAEAVMATQQRLLKAGQHRLRELVRLATELERQASVDDFLRAACQALLAQEGTREVGCYRLRDEHWWHQAHPAVDTARPWLEHRDRIDRVLASGELLYEEDQTLWVYVPLMGSDTPLAVLMLRDEDDMGDREFMTLLAQTLGLAFDNLLQRQNLRRQAMRDSLTGLGNRAQLHDWVREALDRDPDQQATLLLFDLNKFKEINDTLGHHFGDRLLCEIGPRIRDTLGRDDAWGIARLGGDEFAVFLPGLDPDAALAHADLIAEELRRPYLIDAIQLQVEASIGVSHYPAQGRDGHELLRCADVAMYSAKSSARPVVVFDTALDASTPQRIAVLSELDQGLREGHLWVAYQPVISAADGVVTGLEALVRWNHPELGKLSPAEFIPIAEMGRGIRQITDFVLRTSLADLVRWRALKPDLYMAVNLSSRVLLDHALPGQIERLLDEHDLPGSALILELTESTLLSDPARAVAVIEELARLGVELEVDDFGTGYSSLAYLKSLPIQALKIDKSFVADMLHDPQDRVIVESTIQMAHNLGLSTIAEGVEDEATLIELVKMQCDAIQGYYFSRPIPADELLVWLKRNL